MIEIIFAGSIPSNIREKAYEVLQQVSLKIGSGWKKVKGLKNHFSYRLRSGFRILLRIDGRCFVSNHQKYERQIRILKREVN